MVAFIGESDITKPISDNGKMLKYQENISKCIYRSTANQYDYIYYNINVLERYIIIYGLKKKMQIIWIFYLVGSAQRKHWTYAITYFVLWYGYGGPS